MSDLGVLRFLELVKRELCAEDARLEIGGEPPDASHLLWVAAGPERRLVAIFAEEPEEPDDKRAHLAAMVEAFRGAAEGGSEEMALPSTAFALDALDATLEGVASRAGADVAVIIDASSPRVWGCSEPELRQDVGVLVELANAAERASGDGADGATLLGRLREVSGPVDARLPALVSRFDDDDDVLRRLLRCGQVVRLARALARKAPSALGTLRHVERIDGSAVLIRSIAGIYLLALSFDEAFSEPRAEGAIKRGRSRLERLLASVPPVEPPPQGGRVVPLREP